MGGLFSSGQTTTTNSNQKSSSQNSLPSWLLQPYQSALGGASNLYSNIMGATGAGPGMMGQGMSDIAGVNPTAIGAANGSLTNMLNGGFFAPGASQMASANPMIGYEASGGLMNPASNPYLQSAYNQGLQGIENNVDSQFGAAGRNVLAGAPIQADQASNLATDLYGGAYNTNLAAMQNAQGLASGNYNTGVGQIGSAASLAPGITSGLYTQGNQLMNAGQMPMSAQSWYQGLLGQSAAPFGQQNSTGSANSTQKVVSNPSLMSEIGGGLGLLSML